MKPSITIEKADILIASVGLLAALVLVIAAAGLCVGITAIGVFCLLIERCGVVLALAVGILHNVALRRRFGVLHFWFSFKELYGSCPVRLRLFYLGLCLVGAVSFVALKTIKDPIAEPLLAAHSAFTYASFFAIWFSLILAQATSLLYCLRSARSLD